MRAAINILLLAGSLLIALAAVETVLRLRHMYRPPQDPPRPRRPDLYQFDERVGYRLWPSTRMCYRYPVTSGRVLSLNSNSDGFRNPREFDEPDDRVRILVAGDSFILGDGVEVGERLTELLEDLEPGWRVDNLGMTGWGIDLMVRAVETIGPKASPEIVVLGLYTDTFRRQLPFYAGMGFPIPRFRLEGDRLVSVPYPRLAWWQRLRVVQAVHQSYWRRVRNQYELNAALLDRFLVASRRQQFMPVLMFMPGRDDTDEDRERRGFLRRYSEAHDVAYLDLTAAIHGAGIEVAYIRDNWHWSPQGHRIGARELHRVLTSKADLARRESSAAAASPARDGQALQAVNPARAP